MFEELYVGVFWERGQVNVIPIAPKVLFVNSGNLRWFTCTVEKVPKTVPDEAGVGLCEPALVERECVSGEQSEFPSA
jgi:hypothetical protein